MIVIACGASFGQTVLSAPGKRHVLIVSIDGLRPDLMLRANTPTLHHLMEQGSFMLWAQTTAVSVTLPSHVSMLTGVTPQKHQIEWNRDLPLAQPVYPTVPTLFELAKKAGYSTGMAVGKSKLVVLNKPGTLDSVFIPTSDVIPDAEVVKQAVKIIESGVPDVFFVHFPQTDTVGHAIGWATPEQLSTIAGADAGLGTVVDAYRSAGLLDATLIIVSADHGGAGKTHGPDDPRSRHIPWIAVGPGVRSNFDLTTIGDLTVRTEDTFATGCSWLKIRLPLNIDGKPVDAIFVKPNQELVHNADAGVVEGQVVNPSASR